MAKRISRIEEVLNKAIAQDPTIKFLFYNEETDVQDNIKLHIVYNLIRQICQLFPQPLDDGKLRERIAELNSACGFRLCEKYKMPNREGMYDCDHCIADQFLALLQPKIEEAKRRERERADRILVAMVDEIQKNMWNDDWGIKSVIYDTTLNPIVDKHRQALKGGE